jgi:hypothetical protein
MNAIDLIAMELIYDPCRPCTGVEMDISGPGGGCASKMTILPATSPKEQNLKKVLDKVNCSSGVLGDARSFNVQQDSFVEATTFDATNALLAIHSDLLQAGKDGLVLESPFAPSHMEKLRILQE